MRNLTGVGQPNVNVLPHILVVWVDVGYLYTYLYIYNANRLVERKILLRLVKKCKLCKLNINFRWKSGEINLFENFGRKFLLNHQANYI